MTIELFRGEIPEQYEPDAVLEFSKGKLHEVVVIGYTDEGKLYCASSDSSGLNLLWLIERAKYDLMHAATRVEGEE